MCESSRWRHTQYVAPRQQQHQQTFLAPSPATRLHGSHHYISRQGTTHIQGSCEVMEEKAVQRHGSLLALQMQPIMTATNSCVINKWHQSPSNMGSDAGSHLIGSQARHPFLSPPSNMDTHIDGHRQTHVPTQIRSTSKRRAQPR